MCDRETARARAGRGSVRPCERQLVSFDHRSNDYSAPRSHRTRRRLLQKGRSLHTPKGPCCSAISPFFPSFVTFLLSPPFPRPSSPAQSLDPLFAGAGTGIGGRRSDGVLGDPIDRSEDHEAIPWSPRRRRGIRRRNLRPRSPMAERACGWSSRSLIGTTPSCGSCLVIQDPIRSLARYFFFLSYTDCFRTHSLLSPNVLLIVFSVLINFNLFAGIIHEKYYPLIATPT